MRAWAIVLAAGAAVLGVAYTFAFTSSPSIVSSEEGSDRLVQEADGVVEPEQIGKDLVSLLREQLPPSVTTMQFWKAAGQKSADVVSKAAYAEVNSRIANTIDEEVLQEELMGAKKVMDSEVRNLKTVVMQYWNAKGVQTTKRISKAAFDRLNSLISKVISKDYGFAESESMNATATPDGSGTTGIVQFPTMQAIATAKIKLPLSWLAVAFLFLVFSRKTNAKNECKTAKECLLDEADLVPSIDETPVTKGVPSIDETPVTKGVLYESPSPSIFAPVKLSCDEATKEPSSPCLGVGVMKLLGCQPQP